MQKRVALEEKQKGLVSQLEEIRHRRSDQFDHVMDKFNQLKGGVGELLDCSHRSTKSRLINYLSENTNILSEAEACIIPMEKIVKVRSQLASLNSWKSDYFSTSRTQTQLTSLHEELAALLARKRKLLRM